MVEDEIQEDDLEEEDSPGCARAGCILLFLGLLGAIAWFLFPWIGWRRTRHKKKEARRARKQAKKSSSEPSQ